MGRKYRKFYHAKKSSVTSATTSMTECRSPNIGLEDQVFTFDKAKDDDKFKVVKKELGKHFATQTCNNRADASRSFDT